MTDARASAGSRCVAALLLMMAAPLAAQAQSSTDPTDAGKRVYQRANCVGCHKWHGDGGGGYGGDALSLRKMVLTRAQIIQTVNCGRPSTGMPYFARGAFETVDCYGKKRADLADGMPPEANVFLRPAEVEQVADYVLAHVKGKGEPTYDQCIEFFGSGSRACNTFRSDAASAGGGRQDMGGGSK
jgi:mono/diheme cytochrome c family protein